MSESLTLFIPSGAFCLPRYRNRDVDRGREYEVYDQWLHTLPRPQEPGPARCPQVRTPPTPRVISSTSSHRDSPVGTNVVIPCPTSHLRSTQLPKHHGPVWENLSYTRYNHDNMSDGVRLRLFILVNFANAFRIKSDGVGLRLFILVNFANAFRIKQHSMTTGVTVLDCDCLFWLTLPMPMPFT
ncbi:hypothetical protein J6590_024048 [Homalodisca vitripennis]|nr:hypothetical protein J6590_024048 [Homalodisca vitripennis]